MFIGCTVLEKNEMITCKISKLHNCPDKQLLNFQLSSHISQILCDQRTLNFFCILNLMDTLSKKKFMFINRTVLEKNVMITRKISKLHNCPNKQL